MSRCFGEGDPLYEAYHDLEWGRPVRDERALYEKLCLEGFQAGLAWITVLRKRESLRQSFSGFDPDVVATYDGIDHLMADAALIRSRPKLQACVTNARATVALRDQGGLSGLIWSYAAVPSPAYVAWSQVPPQTAASTALARELKRHGFVFVGPTTAYSLMQSHGVVGDHLTTCPVRPECERLRSAARSA